IASLTGYFMSHGVSDQALASHKAIVAVAASLRKQANIMAFSDTFFLIGIALIIALSSSLILKKPAHLSGGAAH
ncbi:EmrB/QacA family drug resistance transporter, partial [Rhizobium lusitanum]|nr:EmrB/QacA family drug resistance transporter [Rhizobium lusitanum]